MDLLVLCDDCEKTYEIRWHVDGVFLSLMQTMIIYYKWMCYYVRLNLEVITIF